MRLSERLRRRVVAWLALPDEDEIGGWIDDAIEAAKSDVKLDVEKVEGDVETLRQDLDGLADDVAAIP